MPAGSSQPDFLEHGSGFLDNIGHQWVAALQSIEGHLAVLDALSVESTGEKGEAGTLIKEVMGHTRVLMHQAEQLRLLHGLVSGSYDAIKKARAKEIMFSKIVSQWIDCFNNYKPLFRERGIRFFIDKDQMNELPNVHCVPEVSQHVIMNLYDNTLKYAHKDSTFNVTGKTLGGIFVEVTFDVASPPVSEQEKELIFERGYRGKATEIQRAKGTGLGLWICRTLLKAMGGDITCVPRPEVGRNWFKLRFRRADIT